ncbi:MAG: glutamate racemase [Chitinophagaceae bacterium]
MSSGKFHPKASHPIGVFDSGIGGLTVAKAINELLPNEHLIYFGDTAHMPYGEKSPHAIKSYSEKIAGFLIEQPCKLVVIACNSASATAFKQVQKILPDKHFVINVIDPVVEHLVSGGNYSKIGLIGTKRTVSSAVYKKKFEKANPDILLKSLATPLLAPMIEEGFFNNNISKTVVHSYLSNPHLSNIESIILACTHYPLIINEISSFYKGKVNIINSAEIVSLAVQNFLRERNLLNENKKAPKHQFYVSDYTESFEETAKIFFGGKIKLREKNLWSDK